MKNHKILYFVVFILLAFILPVFWTPIPTVKKQSANYDNMITLLNDLNISYPDMIELNFDGDIYYDFHRQIGGRIDLYVLGRISQSSLNSMEKIWRRNIKYFPASMFPIACNPPPESVSASLGLLQHSERILLWATESNEPTVNIYMIDQGYVLTMHILPSTRVFVMRLMTAGRR
jgi:hypothetical protein